MEVVGSAVSDRMKYGVKPSAIRSENLLYNLKAVNGTQFSQSTSTDIIFEIPSMGNGYYCDVGNSYFRFKLSTANSTAYNLTSGLRFERGPESLIRRLQITDANGNLLENIEHYNEIYGLTEICTAPIQSRQTIGSFFGENYKGLYGINRVVTSGTWQYTPAAATGDQVYAENAYQDKPDLGSVFVAQSACTAANISGAVALAALNTYVDYYVTFQLLSGIFGAALDKYLPMSAINGLRIVLTMENQIGSCMVVGLAYATDPISTYTTYINDPSLYLNMVRVDPTVDQALIQSSTGPDGLIRIHTQTWSTFSQTVAAGTTSYDYMIPIRVSSLKAIFFGFTRTAGTGAPTNTGANYTGQEVPAGGDFNATQTAALTATNQQCAHMMKASWFQNNLATYQFFIDGRPSPSSAVNVTQTGCFSEAMTELSRAWHVSQKTHDGGYLSLIPSDLSVSVWCKRNLIFGHELESFASKDNVIESGYNTMNSQVQLRTTYASTSNNVNLRVYCLYDVFMTINPATGMIRTEF